MAPSQAIKRHRVKRSFRSTGHQSVKSFPVLIVFSFFVVSVLTRAEEVDRARGDVSHDDRWIPWWPHADIAVLGPGSGSSTGTGPVSGTIAGVDSHGGGGGSGSDRPFWWSWSLRRDNRHGSGGPKDHGTTLRRRLKPESVELPRVLEQGGVTFIRCRNRASAYSAAWLAARQPFLKTDYSDRETLEWHSFNLYNTVKSMAFKSQVHTDFYVVHQSAYEHSLAGARHTLSSNGLEKVAANAKVEHDIACGLNHTFTQRSRVIGIVPFYSGETGNATDTGNAHSISPRDVKLTWVVGTICSMLAWMAHVLVGVCNESDQTSLVEALKVRPRDFVSVACHSSPIFFQPRDDSTGPRIVCIAGRGKGTRSACATSEL